MVIRTQFKAAIKLLICGLLTALIWQGAVASQAESDAPAFTPITAQNAAQVVPLYTTLIPTSDCLKPAPTQIPEGCPSAFAVDSSNTGAPLLSDPTGRYMLTGGSTTMMLWRVVDKTKLMTITELSPFGGGTDFLGFSPDGHYLTWWGVNDQIHLWDNDANVERLQVPLQRNDPRPPDVKFSPDSHILAIGNGQSISLWDMAAATLQASFNIPADHIIFGPDQQTLILLDGPHHLINIIDERTGKISGTYTFNNGNVRNLVVDPNNPRWFLYDATGNDSLVAWNPLTMSDIQLPNDVGTGIGRVWLNPTGDLIFLERDTPSDTGSTAYTEIRNATTWQILTTAPGHGYHITSDGTTLIKSIDSNVIVLGIPDTKRQPGAISLLGRVGADISIHQGPSATSKEIGKLGYYKVGWATGQNKGYVYLADQGGWVRFGDGYFLLDDGFPITYLPLLQSNAAIPFTPTPTATPQPTATPTVMLSATPNSPTPTLAPLILPTTAPGTLSPTGTTPISTTNVSQLQFLNVIPTDINKSTDLISGDGQTIVELSAKPIVWHLANPAKGMPLPIKDLNGIIAAISHNGEYLAYTYNEQTTIHILNLVTGQAQATIAAPEPMFYGFASDPVPLLFSPNDQYLATQTLLHSIVQNWAVADGHLISTIQDNQDYFRFKYSADSTALYSVSVRLFVHRWNVITGQKEQTYNTLANSIAISPDGSTLATIAYGAVNIWDTATQHLKQTFYTLGDTMRFSPDGQSLLTPQTIVFNNPHPVVSVWDVTSGKKNAEVPGNDGWFLTNQDWLAFDPVTKTLTLYDLTGQALVVISWPCQDKLARSVDNHWFGCGTTLLDASNFHLLNNPWNYASTGLSYFTADNSNWVVAQAGRILVFGIPDGTHAAWLPIKAKITVSSLAVHRSPDRSSAQVGTASGTVTITGTDSSGQWLHIDGQGWVRPDFVNLNGYPITQLPILNS